MLALTLALTFVFLVGLAVAVKSAEPRVDVTVTEPGTPDVGDTPQQSGVLALDPVEVNRTRQDSSQAFSSAGPVTVTVRGLYMRESAETWHAKYRWRTRQLQATRTLLFKRWKPTVMYALRLASTAYGVSHSELSRVAACESRYYAFARNGIYRGVFQEGPMFERSAFGRAGFSVFDPIANAMVAALTVSREGWRQWTCRP